MNVRKVVVQREETLRDGARSTVKVVVRAVSSPVAVTWNSPVTFVVVPLATDDVGRLASFSGARYHAEDWLFTRL